MIVCIDHASKKTTETKRFFTDKNAAGFYEWHDWDAEKGLERLVFGVSRKPKNLQAHLERIYYCYQEHLVEQLFGALIDLLIILNKSGMALAKRMISGCQSKLSEPQFAALSALVDSKDEKAETIDSRYSVFSDGLQSDNDLISLTRDIEKNGEDALILAQGSIRFGQIDESIGLLKEAILDHPERLDLHAELLSLYRSTQYKLGFQCFYHDLLSKESALPQGWKQLNNYFFGLNDAENGTSLIAVHGMDGRTVTTISLFLKGPCGGIGHVVSDKEEADVDMFDADQPASKKLLEQHLQENFTRPVIVLSVLDINQQDGVLHLKKPVTVENMVSVLEEAKKVSVQFYDRNSHDTIPQEPAITVKEPAVSGSAEQVDTTTPSTPPTQAASTASDTGKRAETHTSIIQSGVYDNLDQLLDQSDDWLIFKK